MASLDHLAKLAQGSQALRYFQRIQIRRIRACLQFQAKLGLFGAEGHWRLSNLVVSRVRDWGAVEDLVFKDVQSAIKERVLGFCPLCQSFSKVVQYFVKILRVRGVFPLT